MGKGEGGFAKFSVGVEEHGFVDKVLSKEGAVDGGTAFEEEA